MLPIARPIYSDVEIVEIVPLIEPTEHCAFTKKQYIISVRVSFVLYYCLLFCFIYFLYYDFELIV